LPQIDLARHPRGALLSAALLRANNFLDVLPFLSTLGIKVFKGLHRAIAQILDLVPRSDWGLPFLSQTRQRRDFSSAPAINPISNLCNYSKLSNS
jgi:hypothetical protein